ncbi:hypothetical protein EMIHUDRAFT_437876 [Emiliania huxleyi CCMP1516]|uniref:Uncharacterized protein n=2 Tax=Emiliania huxleyi TaxID=2903 RepID=A0A0D3IGW4_EMIH1|nr:hypothetical protein EMIHUDRAFT_437876 [Emiliania huxleyi CCMP1516]EOD10499.1 hypothetical protein EMIHUDRAFT_437876 [Emiliania huxleyi CCMP1516]|eukprot:XP_005762928.1 hypothetical protein EMIHUDRAFT_437876 [Emiliania huxleyi CCMP1516]
MARAELLLKGKRLCALASGGVLITFAVLSLVGCFISFLWVTPIGWMIIISSIWYAAFGGLMIAMQLGYGTKLITANAGFLDSKYGRAMFYFFCGSMAGSSAGSHDAWLVAQIFAYINWGMCWFVGILELCGPKEKVANVLAQHMASQLPVEHVPAANALAQHVPPSF